MCFFEFVSVCVVYVQSTECMTRSRDDEIPTLSIKSHYKLKAAGPVQNIVHLTVNAEHCKDSDVKKTSGLTVADCRCGVSSAYLSIFVSV